MAECGAARLRPAAHRMEYHGLLLLTLGMVAFGLIMVYSAGSGSAVVAGADPLKPLVKQAVYAVVGLVLLTALARLDYHRLRLLVVPLLAGSLLLLLAVMVPGVGVQVNGARRWILVGPLSLQPSEVAKLALLLFTAAVLSARRRPPRTFGQLLNPVGMVALLVCALVVVEPDMGTAIAVALMISGILVVAGTPLRLFAACAGLIAAAGAFLVYHEPYRRARLFSFLHPWQDPVGNGYQNVQALIALGSGGIWGVGLGNGTQKISYLPEAPTDMIVAVIGEELGLIGVTLTVAAFAAFTLLGYRIALRAADPFGRYLATGVTTLVAGQAIVNFGAVLGFLPLTGVPLPLISSGGSSLIVFLSMVGILLNVADSGRAAARARRGAPEASDAGADDGAKRRRLEDARPGRGGRDGGARRAGAGGRRRAVG